MILLREWKDKLQFVWKCLQTVCPTKDLYPSHIKKLQTQQEENNQFQKWTKDLNRYWIKEYIWVTKKYMKSRSSPSAIMVTQIKITEKYHSSPIRMAKIQYTILSVGKDSEQPECSHIAGGNTKWWSHFGKQFGNLLKAKPCTYHETPHPGICPQETNMCSHRNLDVDAYRCSVYNCWTMEAIQLSSAGEQFNKL